MPAVSFILPMYRGASTLPGCLDALLRQRARGWECIAVDDGSPDDSAEVFRRYAARDRRLKLVRHEVNRGVAAARNTGLHHARGQFVCFLDQDDHLMPGGLASLRRCINRHPEAAAAWGSVWLHDVRTGKKIRSVELPTEMTFADFSFCNFGPPLGVLARRELVERVGGLQEGLEGADDWDLWAKLTRTGSPIVACPVLVGEYRIHGANNYFNARRMLLSCLGVVERLYGPDQRVPDPDPAWANGGDAARKPRVQARVLWSEVAPRLHSGDLDAALELVGLFIERVGREALRPESIDELDLYLVRPNFFSPEQFEGYFPALEGRLGEFFGRVGGALGRPDFGEAALRRLRDRSITALAEEVTRLYGMVETYRSSRSYRIGRIITRCLRWW